MFSIVAHIKKLRITVPQVTTRTYCRSKTPVGIGLTLAVRGAEPAALAASDCALRFLVFGVAGETVSPEPEACGSNERTMIGCGLTSMCKGSNSWVVI